MNILITSGGTRVKIDMVRHIANMSNGTFGSRIALSALKRGHNVHFLHATHSKTPFTFYADIHREYNVRDLKDSLEELVELNNRYGHDYYQSTFSDFDEYAIALEKLVSRHHFDAVILAAAASDYGIDNYVNGKIRTTGDMSIDLKPLPKLIGNIKKWSSSTKLVGFKLLVNSNDLDLTNEAQKSIVKNGCDMVVANDLKDIKNNNHKLIIVKPDYVKDYYQSHDDNLYLARQVIKELEQI